MANQHYLIGIDVGGTFTDLLAYSAEEGKLLSAKVPSLPGEQWRGLLEALSELGIASDGIRAFVHGTTIATNALLERKGAKTALVTTQGFRDVLELGKGRRLIGGLFETAWQRPEPIVPRNLRLEVPERISATGAVLDNLDEFDIGPLIEMLAREGIESLAIAFINSYVNPANEEQLAGALAGRVDGLPISQSAALVPERGEFERTSTAVLNAYLTPVMVAYLDTLTRELTGRGIDAPVNIMSSNGGSMTLSAAAEKVAGTFLSGPVGGVGGAVRVADMAGIRDVITFDMGGTSTDVALVHDLAPRMSHNNQIDAFPLQMPQLDIHTIGAGGGSIVWIGEDGTLDIGPQSAGAVPGPACYGRGGDAATISDANLLLGRLPTERSLSGGLVLDRSRAEAVFSSLAGELNTEDLVGLAAGSLRIAVAKMAGAVREVSVHRGFDPRSFALIGFGGAGPMHALLVADELAIPQVLIPRLPGHLSALGQMLADHRRDFVLAWGGRLDQLDIQDLRGRADDMRDNGTRLLEADGISRSRMSHGFSLDVRYAGQSFTLSIPWNPQDDDWSPLRRAFDRRHEETFGYADPDNEAEIVNIRLVSIGRVDKPELSFVPVGSADPLLERRQVWFDAWVDCPVYGRDLMGDAFSFAGPAIVEEAGCTTVVPPGWSVTTEPNGAMICSR